MTGIIWFIRCEGGDEHGILEGSHLPILLWAIVAIRIGKGGCAQKGEGCPKKVGTPFLMT